MGILNKILKENDLTPYSPELLDVIDQKIDKMNVVIDVKQLELNGFKNDKKVFLSSYKDNNPANDKLMVINDNIAKLKMSILDLLEEVNEIESIKNIINYQSKLSGIKKEIGKLNQNDGLDLVSKLKNKT